MPRKITLNTASGAAASTSSGLTTSEVNTLIDAKILSQSSWKGDWEHVESIQKTSDITTSDTVYTIDLTTGYDEGDTVYYKVIFEDFVMYTSTWWRMQMMYNRSGSQGGNNISWRYAGPSGSSVLQSTYNSNYMYWPFNQNLMYGGDTQHTQTFEIELSATRYGSGSILKFQTKLHPTNQSSSGENLSWHVQIPYTDFDGLFFRPNQNIDVSLSANGTGPIVHVYKKPSYTITSS